MEELNSFAVVPQLVLFNPEGVFWESNSGADVVPYPEVPGILSALRFKGVRIGVVAHTQQPYLTSTALSRLTHESFSPMVSVAPSVKNGLLLPDRLVAARQRAWELWLALPCILTSHLQQRCQCVRAPSSAGGRPDAYV